LPAFRSGQEIGYHGECSKHKIELHVSKTALGSLYPYPQQIINWDWDYEAFLASFLTEIPHESTPRTKAQANRI
jgi:hypothetical protein